jgi:hypothetical protein
MERVEAAEMLYKLKTQIYSNFPVIEESVSFGFKWSFQVGRLFYYTSGDFFLVINDETLLVRVE